MVSSAERVKRGGVRKISLLERTRESSRSSTHWWLRKRKGKATGRRTTALGNTLVLILWKAGLNSSVHRSKTYWWFSRSLKKCHFSPCAVSPYSLSTSRLTQTTIRMRQKAWRDPTSPSFMWTANHRSFVTGTNFCGPYTPGFVPTSPGPSPKKDHALTGPRERWTITKTLWSVFSSLNRYGGYALGYCSTCVGLTWELNICVVVGADPNRGDPGSRWRLRLW